LNVSKHATVEIPGSKSVTARSLVLAALSSGVTQLRMPLEAADTQAFARGIAALGFSIDCQPRTWTVVGDPGGPPAPGGSVWCQDAGTAARFLPALAALGHGTFLLDASEQMRARPMAPLLAALRALKVGVDAAPGDRMPLSIAADGLAGGRLVLDAGVSSQYLTALCLVGPATKNGLEIELSGLVSAPYIELTVGMMREFGAQVHWSDQKISIASGAYSARDYTIEPDASTASYFFAAAALTGNTVTIPRLGSKSNQGDLRFATEILARMGCEVVCEPHQTTVTGPDKLVGLGAVAMRDISDTMMTLAAIAPFADGPTRIFDVANTRVKESDRIDAMRDALAACGITTRTGPDWIEIFPGKPHPGVVETRADHRIAMAMSVFGLGVPGGISLDDPSCVAKTFPEFHAVLGSLRAEWDLEGA